MANSVGIHVREIIEAQDRSWHLSLALSAGIAVIIVVSSWYAGLLDSRRLLEGIPSIFSLMREGFPPNFRGAAGWVKPLLDTIAMSISGTALAVVLSFPLALCAASNTSPHQIIYAAARGTLNLLRSVPELIMGIVFVAAVGFGALPGVLALGLHSIGMVGKFFAESIEHVDREPVEAVRAAGARDLQVILHGILPQVLSQMADISIYRWEYNFRASTVMGMVGAGGIGFELMGSLRIMQYRDVSAILLVILVMVTVVDRLGSALRRKFK
jgi:phosphonate transport system permease protein